MRRRTVQLKPLCRTTYNRYNKLSERVIAAHHTRCRTAPLSMHYAVCLCVRGERKLMLSR